MKKRKGRVLYGRKYEGLDEKIRYMLSLTLTERYKQNIGFAELMSISGEDRRYSDARRAFKTVQVIRKK